MNTHQLNQMLQIITNINNIYMPSHCFPTSIFNLDGLSALYLVMIIVNIIILVFMTLTAESFENRYISRPSCKLYK